MAIKYPGPLLHPQLSRARCQGLTNSPVEPVVFTLPAGKISWVGTVPQASASLEGSSWGQLQPE